MSEEKRCICGSNRFTMTRHYIVECVVDGEGRDITVGNLDGEPEADSELTCVRCKRVFDPVTQAQQRCRHEKIKVEYLIGARLGITADFRHTWDQGYDRELERIGGGEDMELIGISDDEEDTFVWKVTCKKCGLVIYNKDDPYVAENLDSWFDADSLADELLDRLQRLPAFRWNERTLRDHDSRTESLEDSKAEDESESSS